jgi:Zn-dependent protease with chaperone function
MFTARCIGVSLAVFVLTYVVMSMLIAVSWRIVFQLLRPSTPRRRADLLCLLRILPLAVSLAITLGFALPSFLLLEPRSTNESVGIAPLVLAISFFGFAALGLYRTAQAQRATSQVMEQWLRDATRLDMDDSVPVYQSRSSTSLTVVGVCAPKIIVSVGAVSVLTARELRTALRHELAHVDCYDNLKKLIFRLTTFPAIRDLEATWSEQTELAADDAAVSGVDEALDLASALIKISRLRPVMSQAEFTIALLQDSTALSTRVERLFAWNGQKSTGPSATSCWIVLVSFGAAALGLVTTYSSLLSGMHELTEWLVR